MAKSKAGTRDLFSGADKHEAEYTAKDIEVLEGLEPVRKRPGMYIGGTDENALHHLISEVFDNSMDEAVAGHATRIEVELLAGNILKVSDNGRGIPIDPHPKFPKKSALEVILTTLHSGGKFSNKAYQTSGGLHGVGISVVNALSDILEVEVVRNKTVYKQDFSKGHAVTKLKQAGTAANRRGTTITFHPDPEIFGTKLQFKPARVYNFIKSKAYLFRGVEIRWNCDPALITADMGIPAEDVIHFEDGLVSYLKDELHGKLTITEEFFTGDVELPEKQGRVEWAIAWPNDGEGFIKTYCNTIYTPQGGTHETGMKTATTKAIKTYAEFKDNKKLEKITSEDILGEACVILSLFIKNPQFQSQTKDKLTNSEVAKLVENAVRDHFDHWLAGNPEDARKLIEYLEERVNERLNRNKKEVSRKTATTRLRLPGKLADCSREGAEGAEIFIVEGDSAGGSAKQARSREFQAILPLRGKILNVASATTDKIMANQEINDLEIALGCGTGSKYNDDDLRYEKVIIMTDADVDGAHIASLLMTFFFQQMPQLITNGHLFLAQPPLFRISTGKEVEYAANDDQKNKIVAKMKGKPEVSRFKGLGEMTPSQLKETTMEVGKRKLLKVTIEDAAAAADIVERLMGKKPEHRLKFIQDNSGDAASNDLLDV